MKTPPRTTRLHMISSTLDTSGSEPLCDVISRITSDTHREVEALPFSTALLAGHLPLAQYTQQLAAWHIIHTALDRACARTEHGLVREVADSSRDRIADLDDDLAWLPPQTLPPTVQTLAERLAADFADWATECPPALLGSLYVFEGAANGGIFMCRFLMDAFGFSDRGCRYYFGSGFETARDWRATKEKINRATPEERSLVVAGAWHTFQQIAEVLQALGSGESPA